MQTFEAAITAADAAAGTVFSPNNGNLDEYSQPPVPYAVGDTWHTTEGTVYICTTANASAFDAADWSNFTFFAQYIAAGTLLTSPTIVIGSGASRIRIEEINGVAYVRFFYNDVELGWLSAGGTVMALETASRLAGVYLDAADDTLLVTGMQLPAPTAHYVGGAGEPAFMNSWTNYGGSFAPAQFFKDVNGTVHLGGLIKSGANGTRAFVLPAGYAPSASRLFPTLANNLLGRIEVQSNGYVIIQVLAGSNAFVSLDGISFPAG
jgi:hypothetical protein